MGGRSLLIAYSLKNKKWALYAFKLLEKFQFLSEWPISR
jgi:hypothetical protein